MTRGVLIFAFDNDEVSYTQFAAWSAQRIHRHLGLPVTLVTDRAMSDATVFDHVIAATAGANGTRTGTWFNLGRYRAAELSPYDETILLDADYVVCSDQLLTLFDSNQDIVSMRWAHDATSRRDYSDLNFFGRHRMPSAWATVIYWRRSHAADLIFGMIEMIESNWQHYKDIYGIAERRFRNDYALAIASNTVMGHTGHWPAIPWSMINVEADCLLQQIDQDEFSISFLNQQTQPRCLTMQGQDFHAMGKQQLGGLIGS